MAKDKKEIRRIEIEPAENGGHTVTHHYKEQSRSKGLRYEFSQPESEHHAFGKHEGHKMLAHVANHLEIPEKQEGHEAVDADEGADGDENEESAAGTAY